MLISCPKCNSVYNVAKEKVSNKGKKFKCAECGTIWMVYPSDVVNSDTTEFLQPIENEVAAQKIAVKETKANQDMAEMFNRLSRDTKNLFSSNSAVDKMTFLQKSKHFIQNNFSPYPVIAVLLTLFLFLNVALLYLYRYDITANVSKMAVVYQKLNLDAVYKGKDIVFKDINLDLSENSGAKSLIISGSLYNSGNSTSRLLPVQIQLLNEKDEVVQQVTDDSSQNILEPQTAALFHTVINNPVDNAIKVKLSFVNKTF